VEQDALLMNVMRGLGSAWRALRLYPASSPMTMEAAQRVCEAVDSYVQAEPSLKLDVVREGFILRGLDGVLSAPGVPDLTDALGAHGVGELHFVAPPTPNEVLVLLGAALLRPQELQERGGMQTVLSAEGVGAIKVVSVVLSKVETPPEIPEEEADKFLAELAADSARLAVWLRSLLASDDEGLTEGILTLATAAGDVSVFGKTLAEAFLELDGEDKDRLLEASIHLDGIRDVLVEMLANLSSVELTAAIRGGRYGHSLSGLSFALTALPVGERSNELAREVEDALRAADAGEPELQLLRQLIDTRRADGVPTPLVDADPLYRAMVDDARLHPDQFDAVISELDERRHIDGRTLTLMLRLLDTADDSTAYARMLDALARSVPHLLEIGDPQLALTVIREVSQRSVASDKPWPGLDALFARAMEEACGPASMSALLGMVCADASTVDYAKELVALGGEAASRSLASASIAAPMENSLECAEWVLGRRLPELLAPEAPVVDARHAAKLAEMCALDGSSVCLQALTHLTQRSEDRVRSETARGVANAGGPAMSAVMPRLLRDESSSVAMVAARALARNGSHEAMSMVARRLAEYEGSKDLTAAKEMVGLLAASPLPIAETTLTELAGKGSFLRKGRGSGLRRLAQDALDAKRAKGGA